MRKSGLKNSPRHREAVTGRSGRPVRSQTSLKPLIIRRDRALHSGAELLIDALQKHPAVAVPDRAIGELLDYVRMSVPGAIRRLGPSRAQLEQVARAKLRERLDAITGRESFVRGVGGGRRAVKARRVLPIGGSGCASRRRGCRNWRRSFTRQPDDSSPD